MEKMKLFIILSILGLITGIASPLPIWPGPGFLRHLPPGIISAVFILSACLGAMKEGSKAVGAIAITYGVLASLAGAAFTYATITAINEEIRVASGIILIGSVIALTIGIIAIILGYKTFKAVKSF
jgi:hypothetical protein